MGNLAPRVSSTAIDHLRNHLWRDSRYARVVNSRQDSEFLVRSFVFRRGKKSKRTGRSRALREPPARLLVWTGTGKARNALIHVPLLLTKTMHHHPHHEPVFMLPMVELLTLHADGSLVARKSDHSSRLLPVKSTKKCGTSETSPTVSSRTATKGGGQS